MKLLLIGDIIGDPGRKTLRQLLPALKAECQPAVTIMNAENAAGGFGLTPAVAEELFALGADVLTSGNHIWDKKQVLEILDKDPRLLRPANYPQGVPGHGFTFFEPTLGMPKIGVLNLEGRVYMHNLLDPFTCGRALLTEMRRETKIIIVDFHAEVTSEKRALGFYLDGLATAVIGTHTHVQTADEEILPGGTAYITDVGMTGGRDSVIGVQKEDAIHRFLHQIPSRFIPAPGRPWLNAILVEADVHTGRALAVKRIQRSYSDSTLS
ncbi:TIGR00282 family metallophosphoesterase [candidate division FCPU426 bacterium]|nr:TIGR00282 family metallophosphoesterase [candidate division FCPU426 bacterium]